jgi:hypothetical protein
MRARLFILAIFLIGVISSCNQKEVPTFEGEPLVSQTLVGICRAKLANVISKKTTISLATAHASGKLDNAYAKTNIIDTANGKAASRSSYTDPKTGNIGPGGSIYLNVKMLNALNKIGSSFVKGISVSEIAGGVHGNGSKHYLGRAFDINVINGIRVIMVTKGKTPEVKQQASDAVKQVVNMCRRNGASLVLDPFSDPEDHSNHVHCEWPKPQTGEDQTVGIPLCESFDIASVSSPTGPHNTPLPVNIFYKGSPKFPVIAEIVITQCPSGLTCSGGKITYETKQQPLTFDAKCNLSSSHPAVTAGFNTTLVDANGVRTNTVAATFTCQPGSSSASASIDTLSSVGFEVTVGP